MTRTLVAALAALGLLAAQAAQAQTRITTRPGPFPGYTETDVTRAAAAGQPGHVTHCTTRPGPFKGQTVTDCQ